MFVTFGQSQSAWTSDSLISMCKCSLHQSQKGDCCLLCLFIWLLNYFFLHRRRNFLSWNWGCKVLLLVNSCDCCISVLVIDASFKACCHEEVLLCTSLVHLKMFLNFCDPFFLMEKSLRIFSMFHFCRDLLIKGIGYLPVFEKVSVRIFFSRRYDPSGRGFISDIS